VEYGEDMVEQIFYACTKAFEIALRSTRQIGTALYSVVSNAETVVAKPGRKVVRPPVSKIASEMTNKGPS